MKVVGGLPALAIAIGVLGIGLVGCTGHSIDPSAGGGPSTNSLVFPNDDGTWLPGEMAAGRIPSLTGRVEVVGVGRFTFEPEDVRTLRPDVFVDGHFSLFDVLVHLNELGLIDLQYRFDDALATHVIESIDGQPHWWYVANYAAGWEENSVLRIDLYPWKDGTILKVQPVTESYLSRIHLTFEQEVQRLAVNDGRVMVPEVTIQDPTGTRVFRDVLVTPHGVRPDILQDGVITALDILLSLGKQGQLSTVGLTWYSAIDRADPIDQYFVERIDDAEAFARCGFVYETGPLEFSGFQGSHIHVATDVRVLVSPDYAYWFWLCL